MATKFAPQLWWRASSVHRAVEASLQRLGRSTIDLYQVHWYPPVIPVPELMAHLAEVRESGLIRAVGVSNFSADQMRLAHRELAACGVPLASNEVEYSLLHRQPEIDGTLDACRELGVTLIAYMPLASGALTGKYRLQARPRGMHRLMPYFRTSNLPRLQALMDVVGEIAGRHNATPSQVALRWLIDQGTLPIPGAKNGRQASANAGAIRFRLERALARARVQPSLPPSVDAAIHALLDPYPTLRPRTALQTLRLLAAALPRGEDATWPAFVQARSDNALRGEGATAQVGDAGSGQPLHGA